MNGETETARLPPPHELDETLLEAFRYIQSTKGKDIRGKLLDSFNYWFGIQDKQVVTAIKSVIADLHNASLLVDDIEDASTLRRGIPVAHEVFGLPIVINTANYVYFAALEKVHRLNEPACMQVFVSELLNLHRGQGREIYWREHLKCPTEEQYLDMIRDKTGGLFRLAIGLLQPFCKRKNNQIKDETTAPNGIDFGSIDMKPLVNDLSVYFQIRDDLLNLVDPDMFELKTFAEDLTEGKFSFPVVHNILHAKERTTENGLSETRLMSILQQKSKKVELKRYAIQLMKESGSLQYCRDTCQVYKDKALREIERLGGNPALVKLIELLDVKLKDLDAAGTLQC